MDKMTLTEVWKQTGIPVVLRRNGKGERIRVRLPSATDKNKWHHRKWLQDGRRSAPDWNDDHKCWELPKAWFNDFVNRSLGKYGKVYIIQPYRVEEKCSPACQKATGHECECSCMGLHHGAGNDGSWFEVSETFAARWSDRELACRLLSRTTINVLETAPG